MASFLLEVRGLTKEYETGVFLRSRRVRVLDGVNLSLRAGDTVGLVGESGCGKTTLARCILKLTDPSAGTIHFDGADLAHLYGAALRRRRRDFQMVFQDALGSLDPRMSVEQVLDEPLQVHGLGGRGERRERIRELLQAVSLDESLLSRRPASLSGGQRQRVGIARALALKPRLLVADEPVSALDASVQAQILNLLLDLQERFTLTLLLISHSLAVVHSMCTRVVVMYLGRVVEEAEAEAFFSGPRHPYSSLLQASAPSMAAGAAAGAPGGGEIPSPANRPPGCAFHPRCPRAAERCRERVPELVEISQGNKVACFLYS